VTNGGGLGILCADACEAAGLEVPATSPAVADRLRAFLPAEAAVGNPVDLLATATPEQFAGAIDVLAATGGVDAIVVLYVPPLTTEPESIAAAIRDAAARGGLPVAAVFAMREPPPSAADLACFKFPEHAAHALARAARYGAWLARRPGRVPAITVDDSAAGALTAEALRRGPGWLQPGEATTLLDLYGIPQPRRTVVPDTAEAALAADDWQAPVALKAIAPGLVHRTEAGAVRTGLAGSDAVLDAAEAMETRLREAGSVTEGFLVQEMTPPGVELLVGVTADPTFGPVVAVAAGGAATELLGDASVRLTPLTDVDAREMVRELRTFPLLDGFRGAPPCDVAAVEDVLLRLSALVENHHEIVEIEINPLIVSREGALAVDVRARVASVPPEVPEPSLRRPVTN
jgi:acyl-CoA synthetase (NDP forming)